MTNKRKSELLQAFEIVLIVFAAIFGPRIFGLLPDEPSILASALWGGVFGGLAGGFTALLRKALVAEDIPPAPPQ